MLGLRDPVEDQLALDSVKTKNQEQKTRARRRGKNDPSERRFVCGCGKLYLQASSLYNHCKLKHDGVYPEGSIRKQPSGQSRPTTKVDDNYIEAVGQPEHVEVSPSLDEAEQEQYNQTHQMFKSNSADTSPTDPLLG